MIARFGALITVLACAGTAHALEILHDVSTINLQPAQGRLEVRPYAGYDHMVLDFKSQNTGSGDPSFTGQTDLAGPTYGVRLEYGFLPELSASFGVSHAESLIQGEYREDDQLNQNSSRSSGWNDIEVGLHMGKDVTPQTRLIFGVTSFLSPEKSRWSSETRDGNVASGGHSLRPSLSLIGYTGPVRVFATTSYRIYGDRKIDGGFSEFIEKKGNLWQSDAGAEVSLGASTAVGAHLGYLLAEGTDTYDARENVETNEGRQLDWFKAGGYAKAQLSPSISLVPSLQYLRVLNKLSESMDTDANAFFGRLLLNFVY